MITNVTKRLFLLLVILIGGFGVIFALPKTPAPPLPGVIMVLPEYIGEWYGRDAAVSQRERDVLGSATRFARKQYTNAQGDAIFVSIVLAGEDMSTSIHRPERCLPSQGYIIVDQHSVKVPLEGHPLTATRLHNLRPLFLDGKPMLTAEGKQRNEFSLIYYWFVGSTQTTAGHTARYFIDARDRLVKGCNQQWAYVTVMSRISASGLEKFGRTEAQTDAMLQDFVKRLTPSIQQPTVEVH